MAALKNKFLKLTACSTVSPRHWGRGLVDKIISIVVFSFWFINIFFFKLI